MAVGGVSAEVQRKVADAISQVVLLPINRIASDGVPVFNALSRAVLHASTNQEASLVDVLGDLEPKARVISFLSTFHEQKRIYRKQIAALIRIFGEVQPWREAVAGDQAFLARLPDDLQESYGLKEPVAPESPQAADAGAPADRADGESAGDAAAAPPPPAAAAPAPELGDGAAAEGSPSTSSSPPARAPVTAKPSAELLRSLRQDFEESFRQIKEMKPGLEPGEAFSAVRKPVAKTQAFDHDTLDTLLSDLEPKIIVLNFLMDLFSTKKMYRNQILNVLTILFQVASWVRTVQFNPEFREGFPQEVQGIFAEAESALASRVRSRLPLPGLPGSMSAPLLTPPAPEGLVEASRCPAGTCTPPPVDSFVSMTEEKKGDGDSPTTERILIRAEDVRAAVQAAKDKIPVPSLRRLDGPGSLKQTEGEDLDKALREAHQYILELMQRRTVLAVCGGDDAIQAFESFRRAVLRSKGAAGMLEDSDPLERLEAKGTVLDFLVHLADAKKKYRARIATTLTILQSRPGWHAAADAETRLAEAVERLLDDRTGLAKTGDGTGVDIRRLADDVIAARTGVGALCVRVVAAYDLGSKETGGRSDPYVKVTLGKKSRKTPVVCDELSPTWNSLPFVFEVPALDSMVEFEVLDSNFGKDTPMGKLSLRAARTRNNFGQGGQRHLLGGVDHGELEVELRYEGEVAAEEPINPGNLLAQAIAVLDAGDPYALQDGELRCTSGHPVTKRKEGLRWHQKFEVWTEKRCSLCEEAIPSSATRWRCHYHCGFDICEECFLSVHDGQSPATRGNSLEQDRYASFGSAPGLKRASSLRLLGRRRGSFSANAPPSAEPPKSQTPRGGLSGSSRTAGPATMTEDAPRSGSVTPPLLVSRVWIADDVRREDNVIFYRVEVEADDGREPWHVMRRYSDFHRLAEQLGPHARSLDQARFPGKTFSPFALTEQQLEERRTALGRWAQRVLEEEPLPRSWWRPLQDFFKQGPLERAAAAAPVFCPPRRWSARTLRNQGDHWTAGTAP